MKASEEWLMIRFEVCSWDGIVGNRQNPYLPPPPCLPAPPADDGSCDQSTARCNRWGVCASSIWATLRPPHATIVSHYIIMSYPTCAPNAQRHCFTALRFTAVPFLSARRVGRRRAFVRVSILFVCLWGVGSLHFCEQFLACLPDRLPWFLCAPTEPPARDPLLSWPLQLVPKVEVVVVGGDFGSGQPCHLFIISTF